MDLKDTNENGAAEYSTWSPDKLLQRIQNLEAELKVANSRLKTANTQLKGLQEPAESLPSKKRSPRVFDHTQYSTRLIALKFAYLGQNYNGFEHHNNNKTPVPTIEEILWKALTKSKLISPPESDANTGNINWDGCEYTKCGRTDRGVSAFGQVIGVRVRSNRPLEKASVIPMELDPAADDTAMASVADDGSDGSMLGFPGLDQDTADEPGASRPEFHDIADEMPYPQILNKILPPDIRILAWCPAPENFSARFNCRERRYRYFFTQPAYMPTPGTPGIEHGLGTGPNGKRRRDGWLDIDAMKAAAKKYEGLHDFRNLCKIDPSKQLDNFKRRIFLSEIREIDPTSEPAAYVSGKDFSQFGADDHPNSRTETVDLQQSPRVYQFVLHGSAFLWHQVRCMVAILFLVGQGLEKPSVIDDLLDAKTNPCRPRYEMAEDAPLVLWDCIFPEEGADSSGVDSLPWTWIGATYEQSRSTAKAKFSSKFGNGAVVDELWKLWRKRKMDEILAGSLLNLAAGAGGVHPPSLMPGRRGEISRMIYQGGESPRSKGAYIGVMQLPCMEPVEVINARYRERKGIEVGPAKDFEESREDHDERRLP